VHVHQLHLSDFMISDGTVLRAEYTLSAVEYKMKDPDRDMNKLGNQPDKDTACIRVPATVLDPDFYVSTTEQVPRMLMEFLIPPGGDEDGPFVGRLEPIEGTTARTAARRVPYRTEYVRTVPVALPPQPRQYVETRTSIAGDATTQGTIQGANLLSSRGRELQSTMV